MISTLDRPVTAAGDALPRARHASVRRPMRLHVLSDLHFDSYPGLLSRPAADADAVVVAGDTCEGAEKAFAFLRAAFPQPMPIVTVLGNRAFHGRVLMEEMNRARELAREYGIRLLENGVTFIRDVRFVGATTWTGYDLAGEAGMPEAMRAAQAGMDDHRHILLTSRPGKLPFMPRHARALFEGSTAYMARVLSEPWDGPTVVVTHHAPSVLSLDPDRVDRSLDDAFAGRLDRMVRGSGAALWIHGHTHSSCDYRLGRTRVVCNPRGEGNPMFDSSLVIEVPR